MTKGLESWLSLVDLCDRTEFRYSGNSSPGVLCSWTFFINVLQPVLRFVPERNTSSPEVFDIRYKTLRSLMHAKFSQQRFRPGYENRHIKTNQKIPHTSQVLVIVDYLGLTWISLRFKTFADWVWHLS